MSASEILDRLDRATVELHAASRAAIQLARATITHTTSRDVEGDDWCRLPTPKTRCPISNWSRSTVCRHITAGSVRAKSVRGSRYYALKDVRELINRESQP